MIMFSNVWLDATCRCVHTDICTSWIYWWWTISKWTRAYFLCL